MEVILNARDPGDRVIFRYDDTLDGLMTAVFESYIHKPAPVAVIGQQHQQELGAFYREIQADTQKAQRTARGIADTMGAESWELVWTGFLSCDPDKGDIIYKYVRMGMKTGRKINAFLAHPVVIGMNDLVRKVSREAMLQQEFTRFARVKTGTGAGVYYGKIAPENDILAMIMPFFTNRFHIQPFVIHDTGRDTAGIFDTKDWYITQTGGLTMPEAGEADEYEYSRLWKRFYDTVAIKERINPRLRRQHMPVKFWKYMPEMTTADTAPRTLLPSEVSRASRTLQGQLKIDNYGC